MLVAGDQNFKALVGGLEAKVGTHPGISDVVANLGSDSPMVSPDRHAALIALRAATDTDIKPVVQAVQAANGTGGFSVAVTGVHTVGNDFDTLSTSDLRNGELDFGLPISIVVLLLVFGAVVAGLLPMMMALLSIIVGLGVATLVGEEFHLSIFIINMMTGMGLALGIDYSLFIVSRFREERAGGLDKHAAIQQTAATASRAVLFSGTTFVIALLGMFLVPTNLLRSMAAGAVVIGVVSVAAALTLLPTMLHLLGDRVNSLRLPIVGKRLGSTDSGESRIWRTFIEGVLPAPRRHVDPDRRRADRVGGAPPRDPHRSERRRDPSRQSPVEAGLRRRAALLPARGPLPGRDRRRRWWCPDPAGPVEARNDPRRRSRFGSGTIQESANGRVSALTVPIRGDVVSSPDVAAVRQLRSDVIPSMFAGSHAEVLVGGQTAETADYFNAVSAPTPYVLLFVLGLSFVLLLLAFRSLVIAIVSILLNLLSVGAAYGLLTLVFIHGSAQASSGSRR